MNPPQRALPPPPPLINTDSVPAVHPQGAVVDQALPPPPPQWQGYEESMKHWLAARAEVDKRKQEEEKTRQETLRLERCRTKHSILREAISAGIPTALIPFIFTGTAATGLLVEGSDDSSDRIRGGRSIRHKRPSPSNGRAHATRQPAQDRRQGPDTDHGAILAMASTAHGPQPGFAYPGYSSPPGPSNRAAPPAMSAYMGDSSTAVGFSNPYSFQGGLRRDSHGFISPHERSATFGHPPPSYINPAERRDQSSSMNLFPFHHWTPPVSQSGTRPLLSDQLSLPQKRRATTEHPPVPVPGSAARLTTEFSSRESTDSPLPAIVAPTSISRLLSQPKRPRRIGDNTAQSTETGTSAGQVYHRGSGPSHVAPDMHEASNPLSPHDMRQLRSPSSKGGPIEDATKPSDWGQRP